MKKAFLIVAIVAMIAMYNVYSESLYGSIKINFCTKWSEKNAEYIDDREWYDWLLLGREAPYELLDENYFDGLIIKYGVGYGYESGQVTLPSPAHDKFNCSLADLHFPLNKSVYLNLLTEYELSTPADDPKDTLIQISPSEIKSCTVKIEYLTSRNIDPELDGADILDNRKISTDCLSYPTLVIGTAICPKVEDLVYEAASLDSKGTYVPNMIKGTSGGYIFKDKNTAFGFDPLVDKSDIVFAGSKINTDKDDINKGVMHCYYKFLHHSYNKLDLKEKFDATLHEVRPIYQLLWNKSIEDYDFLAHSSWDIIYTCPLDSNTPSTQEECKTVILQKRWVYY